MCASVGIWILLECCCEVDETVGTTQRNVQDCTFRSQRPFERSLIVLSRSASLLDPACVQGDESAGGLGGSTRSSAAADRRSTPAALSHLIPLSLPLFLLSLRCPSTHLVNSIHKSPSFFHLQLLILSCSLIGYIPNHGYSFSFHFFRRMSSLLSSKMINRKHFQNLFSSSRALGSESST